MMEIGLPISQQSSSMTEWRYDGITNYTTHTYMPQWRFRAAYSDVQFEVCALYFAGLFSTVNACMCVCVYVLFTPALLLWRWPSHEEEVL